MDTQIKEEVKGHNLLKLIGSTPLVDILRERHPQSEVKIKPDSYNPGGSIKYRVAYQIISGDENFDDIISTCIMD